MDKKTKPISGVRISYNGGTRLFFTKEEKHLIIQDYFSSGKTRKEIWRKYTGHKEERGHLLRWMRQLGYKEGGLLRKPTLASNIPNMSKDNKKGESPEYAGEAELKREIEKLEKQLKDAEMKTLAYSTMIDIAEKELEISIKKKFNTKSSKK